MVFGNLEVYVALVPEDETLVNPSPTEYRPISVLSGVYRLWSRSRAYSDDNFAVGISYGFRKAFDLILSDIMLATMERRGVDKRI